MENKKREYGKDELTFSINANDFKEEDKQKLADAGYPDAIPSDHKGKLMIDGQQYYMNGYQKNGTWIAGTLKKKNDKKVPF